MSSSNDNISRSNGNYPNIGSSDNNSNTNNTTYNRTDSSTSYPNLNESSSSSASSQQQQLLGLTPTSHPPRYTPNDSNDSLNSNNNTAFPASSISSFDAAQPPEEPKRRKRGYSLRTQLFAKNINNQNEPPSPIELQQQTFSPSPAFGPHNSGMIFCYRILFVFH